MMLNISVAMAPRVLMAIACSQMVTAQQVEVDRVRQFYMAQMDATDNIEVSYLSWSWDREGDSLLLNSIRVNRWCRSAGREFLEVWSDPVPVARRGSTADGLDVDMRDAVRRHVPQILELPPDQVICWQRGEFFKWSLDSLNGRVGWLGSQHLNGRLFDVRDHFHMAIGMDFQQWLSLADWDDARVVVVPGRVDTTIWLERPSRVMAFAYSASSGDLEEWSIAYRKNGVDESDVVANLHSNPDRRIHVDGWIAGPGRSKLPLACAAYASISPAYVMHYEVHMWSPARRVLATDFTLSPPDAKGLPVLSVRNRFAVPGSDLRGLSDARESPQTNADLMAGGLVVLGLTFWVGIMMLVKRRRRMRGGAYDAG